jgi:hypothetical protein
MLKYLWEEKLELLETLKKFMLAEQLQEKYTMETPFPEEEKNITDIEPIEITTKLFRTL